jgi:TrkA domain protein
VAEIEEVALPGVGQRFEFVSEEGRRIGVVHHKAGPRELFVCSPADPDAVTMSVRLSDDESHALADALGGSTLIERLAHLEERVEGLAIDWVRLDEGTPYVDRTIGEARIRTETGVTVVAVVRDETPHPAPGPDFRFAAGDTLVLVGTPDGIASARLIMTPN